VGDARLLLEGVAVPPVEHSIPHNAARVLRSRASDMNTAAVANLRMELGAKNAPSEGVGSGGGSTLPDVDIGGGYIFPEDCSTLGFVV
jgi:hypothetical protein